MPDLECFWRTEIAVKNRCIFPENIHTYLFGGLGFIICLPLKSLQSFESHTMREINHEEQIEIKA